MLAGSQAYFWEHVLDLARHAGRRDQYQSLAQPNCPLAPCRAGHRTVGCLCTKSTLPAELTLQGILATQKGEQSA